MRLFALSCGRLSIPASYLTPGQQPERLIETRVGMFVLEHARGLLLFDTGAAPECVDDLPGWWGAGMAEAFPYQLRAEDIIDEQLRALGYKPGDVRHVVLSHLHLDHAGGMKLFPQARFYVQAHELARALWPGPLFQNDYVLADLLPTRRFEIRALDGDADLFGDGSVRVLATPGHTRGHCSLLLRLPTTGAVLLPGDACLCSHAFAHSLPPGQPLQSPSLWRTSLRRLRAEVEAGALPLWSHEPIEAGGGGPLCFE